jgi:preprotein translocase subunit SecD
MEQGPDGEPVEVVEKRIPLKLGLDLQGGMHLAVEIDQSGGPVANPGDALDRAETVIRSRVDEFGVAEPLIQRVGTERIIIELPGITDPAQAKDIVSRSAFLEFRITDMQQQFADALPAIDAALARAGVRPMAGERSRTESAIDLILGTDSADRQSDSTAAESDSTVAESGATSETVFSELLSYQQGGIPGEFLVPEEYQAHADSLIRHPAFQRALPRGLTMFWGDEPISQGARPFFPLYALQSRALITGEELSDAQAQIDQTMNQAVVNFTLTRRGGRVFGRATAENVGNYMAIVLDGRVQGRPPVIRSQISRNGQIELGSSQISDAQDLALVLRAGALPAPIEIVEERTVGPSLGRDSVARGQRAGIVAITLVVVMIALYYRTAGLLAIGGLVFYVIFALGGLAMIDATLTLPGLAGFVLSLGLAVDANVLIFERIREELALNKSPRTAVDSGFQHAMPAIIDANVTTVIMAAFLFQFGTGAVQGFAVTLIIGIVASLLTAVFVTRTFFLIWLQRRSPSAQLSI